MDAKCTNIKNLYHEMIVLLYQTKLPKDGLIRHIMEFVMYDELDNGTLRQAVREWHKSVNMDELRFKYGPFIRCWNTSKVTSLFRLFRNVHNFNEDISGWDVSNVWTMHEMLCFTQNFDGNLTGWDIGKVQCVEDLFPMQDDGVCELKIISMVDGLEYKLLQLQNSTRMCNCLFDSWKWNKTNITLTFGLSHNQPIILGKNVGRWTFGLSHDQPIILG